MKREKSKIIKTVKVVMPAVVSVVISKSLKELEKELPEFRPTKNSKHPHLRIPPDKVDAHGMVQIGGGSGFIVDDGGIILTNKHVIAEPNGDYDVITSWNERFDAQILARDPINDVAILKINPNKKLPILELGDSDHLELGQTVLAFGNALGIFQNTVSAGIISGLSRSVSAQADTDSPPQDMRGLIQTDAAINPGNSGGPLTNVFGKVIGINAAVVAGAQNINFAIPIKAALRDLQDLKKYGRIKRPLLGLRYLTINADLKEKMRLPADYGALVTKEHPIDHAVIPGSPSAKAGILEKDIILEWGGQKITSEKSIQDYLENCEVGEKVKLKILRKGEETETEVVLTERK